MTPTRAFLSHRCSSLFRPSTDSCGCGASVISNSVAWRNAVLVRGRRPKKKNKGADIWGGRLVFFSIRFIFFSIRLRPNPLPKTSPTSLQNPLFSLYQRGLLFTISFLLWTRLFFGSSSVNVLWNTSSLFSFFPPNSHDHHGVEVICSKSEAPRFV